MRARYCLMFLLTTLAAAGIAPLTHAAPHADVIRTAAVAWSDLDLSKDAGVQTLYRRIQSAARAVCRAADLDFDLEGRRSQRACVREAVAEAVERVGNASLRTLHDNEAAQANRLW